MAEETNNNELNDKGTTNKRCFVMMPISDQGDYPSGHFDKVYNQIFKPAIQDAGYIPYRVDENTISDSIINKIFDAVQNCEMALCDLSNRNPNVLYELGLRQAYNKPVVLVCDDKTEKIFDVSGISTVFYKSDRLYENVIDAQEKILASIKSTCEGKEATLIQVVQATEANYSDVMIDKNESLNIMLQSIIKELRELKRENDFHENINLKNSDIIIKLHVSNKNNYDKQQINETLSVIKRLFKRINNIDIHYWSNEIIIIKIDCYEYHTFKNSLSTYIDTYIGPILGMTYDTSHVWIKKPVDELN